MKKINLIIYTLLILALDNFAQTIIENPEKPRNAQAGRVVTLEETAHIVDTGEHFYFRYPRNLKVAPDASIFIMDIDQLIRFNPEGQFLSNYFKKGQGPGETEYISDYCLTDRHIIVHSSSPPKIFWLDYEGEVVKEFKILEKVSFLTFLFFDNDTYYFRAFEIPIKEGAPGVTEMPQTIISSHQDGKEMSVLGSFPTQSFVTSGTGARGAIPINNLIIAHSDKFLFISHKPDYEVKVYDLESQQTIRIFRRKYNRVKPPSDFDPEKMGRVIINGVTYSAPRPKYLNDISCLFVQEGRLWVLTSSLDEKKGILIDVFTPDGSYVDDFYLKIPDKISPIDIGRAVIVSGEYIYLIIQDKEENYFIRKCRLPGSKP